MLPDVVNTPLHTVAMLDSLMDIKDCTEAEVACGQEDQDSRGLEVEKSTLSSSHVLTRLYSFKGIIYGSAGPPKPDRQYD